MNYPRYQKIACKQIQEYGQVVTFRLREGDSAPPYDPITGHYVEEVTEVATHAVLLRPEEKFLRMGTVAIGDAMLLVGGGTMPQDPDERSTVIVSGEEWRVLSVSRVAPSGLVILYKVFIRRA